MKVLLITNKAFKKLNDYKKWSKKESFSETIETIDEELQQRLPKDSIYNRKSRKQ